MTIFISFDKEECSIFVAVHSRRNFLYHIGSFPFCRSVKEEILEKWEGKGNIKRKLIIALGKTFVKYNA